MIEFPMLTLVYIFLIVLCIAIFLYYKRFEKEDRINWESPVAAIAAGSFLAVLVIHMMLLSYVESDHVCGADIIDESDGIADDWEFFTNAKEVHSQRWSLEQQYINQYQTAEFCFTYNNTDSGNNIHLVVGIADMTTIDTTNHIAYVLNQTVGVKCISLEKEYLHDEMIIGISCDDCAVGNQLGIGLDYSTPDNEHLYSTGSTIEYTIDLHDPHLYELKLYPDCKRIVQQFSWKFFFIMGLLLFAAMIYGIVSFFYNAYKKIEKS